MKRTNLVAVCAAALHLAGAFAAHALDKVVITNDWLPGGDKALPYYALEKGLFAAEGLDVTIQSARGSSEVITKIATGVSDMGGGGMTALLQAKAESDVPVKAVLSIFPTQPDALFTVEGSSVKTLKDIEGKKVATATFTSSNILWPAVLKANGIDAGKITLLKVDPNALVPLLSTGQVDATINWSTASPGFVNALGQSGKKLHILLWSDFGLDGYGNTLFASKKMIEERPDVLRRVIKAYVKGIKMALADSKDVARAMKARFPEMDEALVEQQFLTIVPLIDNPISRAEGFGTFDRARLARTWEWTARSQNMPLEKLDPETAVDRSFLPK